MITERRLDELLMWATNDIVSRDDIIAAVPELIAHIRKLYKVIEMTGAELADAMLIVERMP